MNEQKETGIIKAGMAIVLSYGCYSDYSFGQVYVCAKDFNYIEQAKIFYFQEAEKEYSENGEDLYLYSYSLYKGFEDYLIKNGFLILCENREIHIGDSDFFYEQEWEKEFLEGRE